MFARRFLRFLNEHKCLLAVLVFFAAFFLVYYPTTRPTASRYMHHIEQAEAFLNLRVDIDNRYSMEELILRDNKYYNIFPHGPTLFILPFFAIFGYGFSFKAMILILSLLSIVCMYFTMRRMTSSQLTVFALLIVFVFGTVFLWVANQAGVWFTNQIFGILFCFLMLNECFGKKRVLLIAIFLGFAIISRHLLVFYSIFAFCVVVSKYLNPEANHRPLWALFELKSKKLFWRDIFILVTITVLFCASYLLLNYLKFGSPFDTGYDKIIRHSWFGSEYLVRNLHVFFFKAPVYTHEFPFLLPPPDREGQAVIFTTPLVFLAFCGGIKKRYLIPILLTILPIFVVHMLHQGSGGRQFGYRYILDYLPLIFCLLALKYREGVDWKFVTLSVLSILFTLDGVLHLRVYY